MKTALCLTVAALALVCAAAQSNPRCDPSYECGYIYISPQHYEYEYKFAALCSDSDYVLEDSKLHRYHANICGSAAQSCLPLGWHNTYEFGVAVQSWGAIPPCSAEPQCQDPATGKAVCCTADCQVLGTGPPLWSLIDESNPETGGVRASFRGVAASDSDPFWCEFNPATGAQYEREVVMELHCDPESKGIATPISADMDPKNDCHFTLHFNTSLACAKPRDLAGSLRGATPF